ncbi:zinc-dependent peptidase [Rhizobacter sp. AJA081-3]|uniref:M90 family metallopeptidase n=1 Tax=Rhizobacter sp. AJA081-3 TaxID=2753607 RepID=UPI001AE07D40|nr:M90 family metallopeptidase [Rhizobacter sp. AJA081-3]QTN25165.1 zinc-dependent peptidase [Rhizobacter sp. AJA081-3]
MIGGWWRRRREARMLVQRAIPEDLWRLTLSRFPFLVHRTVDDLQRLRELSTLFLADKEFAGMQGLEVDDGMAVAIAAQACLPILRLGLSQYDAFKGIVVHPDVVVARREVMDEDGVVHHYDEELSGEAMEGGPVMLSWRDVADAGDSAAWGYNVVIHEFAHVLDMRDGAPDGVPLLPDRAARERWLAVLEPQWQDFCARVDAGEDTLIDPYGAEAIDEFFAVASEVFFVDAPALRAEHPQLYELLAGYYRQDPAAP